MVAVEHIRIEVNTKRPAHRARHGIDRSHPEDCVIVERGEHTGKRPDEIEFTDEPVRERHA